ncbi:MAG: flagellar basal body P-ring protein FlgI, partial [Myxococcota bacterium]
TTGMVPGGAMVERENDRALDYASLESTEFVLDNPDFATASALEEAVNGAFGSEVAQAVSASTIKMTIPEDLRGRFPRFAAQVEAVDIKVDTPARVAINERTGTVVMGGNVTISPVAVAHGGLTVEVRRVNQASQPSPLSFGNTALITNVEVEANEADGKLTLVEGAAIADLVAALNSLGVKPRDLVVILHAIRNAGALQAEIIIQ